MTTDLERWYRITGNGRLQMRDETPKNCPQFRQNLRRLMAAKMHKRPNRKD